MISSASTEGIVRPALVSRFPASLTCKMCFLNGTQAKMFAHSSIVSSQLQLCTELQERHVCVFTTVAQAGNWFLAKIV